MPPSSVRPFLAAIAAVVFFSGIAKDAEPPNIVFIYTDAQAPTAIGASGNSQINPGREQAPGLTPKTVTWCEMLADAEVSR